MPFSVGPMELILVLAIALIVLGPKRLPEAGRALGKGLREFKDSVSGIGRTTTMTRTRASPPRSSERGQHRRSALVQLDRALLDQIVAQAHAEAPNECCGIIAAQAGKAVAVHPGQERRRLARCATRWTAWSSTRSSPRSRTPGTSSGRSTTRTRAPPPFPSQTDINLAVLSRGALRDRRRRG